MLGRPANSLVFLFPRLSSGVEQPGENPWVPSKWNSESSLLGDYTCSDLVVKIKECKRREGPTTSKPEPAALEPAPATGPEAPALSEDCLERQQTPASSLTLQVRPSVLASVSSTMEDLSWGVGGHTASLPLLEP